MKTELFRFDRRARRLVAVLALLALLPARAAYGEGSGSLRVAERSSTPGDAGVPTSFERPASAFEPPIGGVTLRDAISAALLNNPELAMFAWEMRAREARGLQAGLLPNPELRTEVEDFAGSSERNAFRSSQTTVSLAQLVELGGKRAKRRRLAELQQELAGWDYEARRLGVFAEVTTAFVTLLATQERLALAEDLSRLARQSVRTVAGTVKTGAVSPVEEARARVAMTRAEIERAQLVREVEAARVALAATWGATTVTFSNAAGDLHRVEAPPALDAFLAHVDANPDLARWVAELAEREAVLAVERARRIPDPTVGLGGRHFADDGSGALVLELSLPLALFDRNQGGILEATHRLAKGKAERHAAEVGLRSQLGRAYQTLAGAFDQVRSLRDVAIPQATTVFDGAADAYAKGLFRYIEVLDAQRTLFELRSQYLQALAAYHSAVAEIERLSGAPLASPQHDDRRL